MLSLLQAEWKKQIKAERAEGRANKMPKDVKKRKIKKGKKEK